MRARKEIEDTTGLKYRIGPAMPIDAQYKAVSIELLLDIRDLLQANSSPL